jgi:hypothetical protein
MRMELIPGHFATTQHLEPNHMAPSPEGRNTEQFRTLLMIYSVNSHSCCPVDYATIDIC